MVKSILRLLVVANAVVVVALVMACFVVMATSFVVAAETEQ